MDKTDSVRVHVLASPERVWALLSDVTRMPEFSPTVQRCEWVEGDGPKPGARFRGYNRQGGARWSRECRIVTADEPRELVFSTLDKAGGEQTRWRYVLEPRDGGTDVVESFEVVSSPLYIRLAAGLMGRRFGAQRRAGMEATLQRIKEAAERA